MSPEFTNETHGTSSESGPERARFKRFLPVLLLIIVAAAIYAFDLQMYLSFDALRDHRHTLIAFVERNFELAALLFIVVYAAATSMSLPGGAVLSITGGFLFGGLLGGALVVIGATIGATGIFLIAKTALGDSLRQRAGAWLKKMEEGFRENALSYLLTLRLIPLFPFFVVNLVPAFLGVRLGIYVLGTAIGIIPGALVFTFAGAGVAAVFDSGEEFSASAILSPEILAALTGLGLLALLPVIYQRYKARKKPAVQPSVGLVQTRGCGVR